MRGGAELHRENLISALIEAGHRADLVHLPVGWEKDRLFDAALAWRMIPLDADLVIATNFPSYFARHPRKVIWLFHQHRGAYDAVDAPWSDLGLDDGSLDAQVLLSDWDARAFGEATKLFTTSATVADRVARYNGMHATPLYHPPPLHDRLHEGEYGNYIFCPSRLEQNKRPLLAVEGLGASSTATRLVLAGTGSLEAEVTAVARRLGVDGRIDLPGFVSDDELITQYAGALGVIYAPFDEDYGYVTLQAFLAKKPVITAADAGGVLEWVEDGVTGIVTDGTPAQIGEAIDRLASDRDLARKMGEAGYERARELRWSDVVEQLTAP
jgi:glycosyltransferase involved in cell wall biosynthesis